MTQTDIRFDEKGIWLVVSAGILTGIGLFGAGRFMGISEVGFWHVSAAALVLLILSVMGQISLRLRVIGLAGAAVLLPGAAFAVGFGNCLWFARSYLHWLVGSRPWQAEWTVGYELVQTVFIAAVCYFAAKVAEKDFRVKMLAAFGLAAAFLYALFTEQRMEKTGVALILCFLVMTYVEWTQIHWHKEKRRSRQAYMLWTMPFMTLYVSLMLLSAAPEKPYQWQFVKDVYGRLQESFVRISFRLSSGGGENYDLSLGGFSGREELEGNIGADRREIMRLQNNNGTISNVYLTGKVYDTFDGRQWEQMCEDTAKERYLDTVETIYGAKRYDGQHLADYLKYVDLDVEYRYFRSQFLFAPLKPLGLTQGGGHLDFDKVGGSLLFDRTKGFGTQYRASYYQLNMGQENFERLLDKAWELEEDEEMLTGLLAELRRRTGEEVSLSDLWQHRTEVVEHYSGDTQVSDEVRAYLDEVTAGAQTRIERLRAIEAELASMEYTQTPGELPGTVMDSGEFLDFFLLESRRGYCSHFATAFTLLARAEGFPARYVQGFCVSMEPEGKTPVYSDMAHAWPEVYLDGIGWIPFEPTPGYFAVRYDPWAVQGEWTQRPYANALPQENQGGKEHGQEEGRAKEEVIETVGYTIDGAEVIRILRMAAVLLLSVLGAGVVVCVLGRLSGRYRYMRMDEEEKLQAEVHRSLQILSFLGMKREDETLEEFRKRLDKQLPEEGMLGFLEDYEEVLYGSRRADRDMLEKTKRQQEALAMLLKQEKKWMYIRYKIIDANAQTRGKTRSRYQDKIL